MVSSWRSVESELTGGVKLGYRPALDGLRAIAVLLVIAYDFNRQGYPIRGGFIGVDLFFVLSGFLITRLLFEEGTRTGHVALGGFYLRRVARLLPALVLVLAFVGLLNQLGQFGPTANLGIISSALYVSNWVGIANNIAPFEHTWSLAIEEQFYILWPIAFILLFRHRGVRSVRNAAVVIVAFCLVETAGRFLLGQSPEVLYRGTDSHGAVFLGIGCLLACTLSVQQGADTGGLAKISRVTLGPGVALMVFLLISVSWTTGFYYLGGFLVTGACLVGLVSAALTFDPLRRALSVRPLVWVGRISYGLYLWHAVMLRFLPNTMRRAGMGTLGPLALTFLFATASFYLVERPLRRRIRGGDPVHPVPVGI